MGFVEVYYTKHGFIHLLINPATSTDVFVVTIDSTTGNPMFVGIKNLDIFETHDLAIKFITDKFESQLKFKGEALIGMAQVDNVYNIAIIDKTEQTGFLPGGHVIKTIRHVMFMTINTLNSKQTKNPFEEFQLCDNHYFCETYDISRLYPSQYPAYDPDKSFCWNNGWTKPFELMGIRNCCVTLLQGIGQTYESPDKEYTISHICRRSSDNPGTRYAARGLNSKGAAGNEVEAELIFIKGDKWISSRWRRGSIPIHWSTVLNSKVSSPVHTVDKENYFEGTPEYFKNLKSRFNVNDVRCVSLLQMNEGHSESEILEYFKMAIGRLYDAGVENVYYTPFDLNQRLHEDGSGEAMSDFISFIGPMMDDSGLNTGEGDKVLSLQKILFRFNCADSLDRTNLATFFFAMYATAKWCKMNGYANENASPTALPNEVVPQHIIDFLAKSFVECGNIVAQLYTNTAAIKVKAIKKFSPSLENSSNDTAVTLQRRLENVINDPVRQRAIELWVDPVPFSWHHRLAHTHIRVIEGAPHMIVENNVAAFRLDNGTVTLCLQFPMIVNAVLLMLLPSGDEAPRNMKIETGLTTENMELVADLSLPVVDSATWCRYRVGMQEKWGYTHSHVRFVQFVRFTFSQNTNVVIGNIKIESRSNPDKTGVLSIQEFKTPDQQTIERFDHGFNDFAQSKKTLCDTMKLEKLRLGLHVPDDERITRCLANNIPPWFADSNSRIAAGYGETCANCLKKLLENDIRYRMRQAWLIQGLLVSEDKPGTQKTILICKNCIDEVYLYSQGTEGYENLLRTSVKPPISPPHKQNLEEIDGCRDISSNTQAIVCSGPRSILLEEVVEFEGKLDFCLSFFMNANVKFVKLETDSEITLKANEVTAAKDVLDNGDIIYRFSETVSSNIIRFSIESPSFTSVRRLRVFGDLSEEQEQKSLAMDTRQFISKQNITTGVTSMIYEISQRTERCPLGDLRLIKQIVVEMRPGGPNCLSFVINLKKKNNTVYQKSFVIPETGPGVKMSFFPDCTESCDNVVIYYLDRTASFRTPLFRFIF